MNLGMVHLEVQMRLESSEKLSLICFLFCNLFIYHFFAVNLLPTLVNLTFLHCFGDKFVTFLSQIGCPKAQTYEVVILVL